MSSIKSRLFCLKAAATREISKLYQILMIEKVIAELGKNRGPLCRN